MTTDQHRTFARRQAPLIWQKLLARGDRRLIATSLTGEEVLYRGLLCECDFADKFGLPLRTEIFEYGDGGVDFVLLMRTKYGVQEITINVKAKSILYGGWDGWQRLAASGTDLRVPIRECVPERLYVFGIYLVGDDEAEVLRWMWGKKLIERNERQVFENSDGTLIYTYPYKELRGLQELRDHLL